MSMTRSMAAVFAERGIHVNTLAPGTVDTDMVRETHLERVESMHRAAFMRRAAHPDELVGPRCCCAPTQAASSPDRSSSLTAASPPTSAVATILVEPVAEHVTALRLNRPDRLNAIDFTLVGDLHDALDDIAADDACKVVILSGVGRAFCAGLDLKDWGEIPTPGSHRHFNAGQNGQSYLSNLMQHLPRHHRSCSQQSMARHSAADSRWRSRAICASLQRRRPSARRSSAPASPGPTPASLTCSLG